MFGSEERAVLGDGELELVGQGSGDVVVGEFCDALRALVNQVGSLDGGVLLLEDQGLDDRALELLG